MCGTDTLQSASVLKREKVQGQRVHCKVNVLKRGYRGQRVHCKVQAFSREGSSRVKGYTVKSMFLREKIQGQRVHCKVSVLKREGPGSKGTLQSQCS